MSWLQQQILDALLATGRPGLDFAEIVEQTGYSDHSVVFALEDLHHQGLVALHSEQPMWRPARTAVAA